MIQRAVNNGLATLLLLLSVGLLQSCAPGSGSTKGGKSCLDCHSEYKQLFSQGVVHKPVKAGDCAGCHRQHGLIGGAYLKQEGATLCFGCHQSLARELTENTLHHTPVGKGQCSVCHQSHNSPNSKLLNQPEEQLCFECHDRGPFNYKHVHAALEKGCRTCHETHGSKITKLLIKEETALCQDCHDTGKNSFIVAHGGYPVEQACSDCHSVHSADNSSLLKEFTHAPVTSKNCSACHALADSAAPFSVAEKSAALCYSCHDQQQAEFKANNAHSPVSDGDCFACHSPHASDFKGISKADPQTLCFECHNFKFFGSQTKAEGGFVHTPAAGGDCLACHGPHLPGKGQEKLLRKDAANLCLDCHADKEQPQSVNHQPVVEGECLSCHLPHESAHAGVLTQSQRPLCAECHQVVGEDLGLPSLHRPFVAGKCSSCHDPHGGKQKQLLLKSGAEGCGQCHGTIETERQTASHQPFKDGRCELCHKSHGSQQPFLLTKAAKDLCVDCHGDHNPPEGTPGGHQNCTVCHYSHGNDEENYLLKQQPDLCLGCHDINRHWGNGVGHEPAVNGHCGACHDPHAPQLSGSRKSDADYCVACHAVDKAALTASHKGISPGKDSCLGCHDPHGGADASLTLPIKHAPFAAGNCRPCHAGGAK